MTSASQPPKENQDAAHHDATARVATRRADDPRWQRAEAWMSAYIKLCERAARTLSAARDARHASHTRRDR